MIRALFERLFEAVAATGATNQVALSRNAVEEISACVATPVALVFFAAWAVAVLVNRGGSLGRLLARGAAAVRARPWVLLLVLALWVCLFGAIVNTCVMGGIPHIHDEIAYRFQAKIMARGRLWAPAPPAAWRDGLNYPFCPVAGGRWFGRYWFGWPALLALGEVLGRPGWVAPALNGVALALMAVVLLRVGGVRLGLVAACLAAASPFVLFVGASQMNHALMLTLVAASLLIHLAVLREGPTTGRLVGLSCLAGYGVSVRPVTAVALMGPLWLHAVLGAARRRRRGAVAAAVLVAACWVALLGLYNRALTGSPFTSPILLADGGDRYGFGHIEAGGGFEHNLPAAGMNLLVNLYVMNEDLSGLAHLSLLLPLIGLAGAWRRLPPSWRPLPLLMVLAYGGYWTTGCIYGARYYYELLPFLLLAAACGVEAIARWSRRWGGFSLPAFCLVLSLAPVLAYVPNRLFQMRNYWGVFPKAVAIADTLPVRGRVFVVDPILWSTLFSLNGPFLDGKNLFWNGKAGAVPADLLEDRGGGLPPLRFPTEAVVVEERPVGGGALPSPAAGS